MKSKNKIIVEACYTQQINNFTRETLVTITMPIFDGWEKYHTIEASTMPDVPWTRELRNSTMHILRKYLDDPSTWQLEYIEFIGTEE